MIDLITIIGWEVIITAVGIIYILSPIDLLPEVMLGPIGFTDDALVAAGIVFAWFGGFILNWAQQSMVNAILAVVGVLAGLVIVGKLFSVLFRGFGGRSVGRGKWGVKDVDAVKYYPQRSVVPSYSSFVKFKWR